MSNRNEATANAPSEPTGIIGCSLGTIFAVLKVTHKRTFGEGSAVSLTLQVIHSYSHPMKRRLPKNHLTHPKECSARNYATLMSLYSAYGSVNYPMIVPVGDVSCTCVPQATPIHEFVASE